MAGPQRLPAPALTERIAREGHRFEFFQAVALLERLLGGVVGAGDSLADEAIAFRHDPRFVFHAGDVASIAFEARPEGGDVRAVVTSTFLGLTGTASPLPTHMAEAVLQAEASDEPSLRAFYDVLHHRLLSLFYRGWAKYRLQAHGQPGGDELTARQLLSLLGFDSGAGPPADGVAPATFLAFAPLLALRSRSARSLTLALETLLPGVCVRVENFVERRVPLTPPQRASLGVCNTTLGVNVTIGHAVVDRNGRFRVRLGPLTREGFEALSPGGSQHALLVAIVVTFSGGLLEAEIELLLASDAVPRLRLGDARGCVLGRNTRLATADREGLLTRFVLSVDGTVHAEGFRTWEAT